MLHNANLAGHHTDLSYSYIGMHAEKGFVSI